ncbi:hypothetical protein [Mesorhizobium sp. CAU 1741]|uniref:helix-turn-helix transcriptional regulator n=1 Tax=Mesorhizobium sp. CAU 1741 TaxID=3140366 RepID=UPI00325B816E
MSDLLREAAWGRIGWEVICRKLTDALPGSMMSLINYDMPRGTINAAFQHGMAPHYLESYRAYYASINPWVDFWAGQPPGRIGLSERDSPSAAFRDSEFFNDWLAPQGNAEAGAGLRLDVDAHNTVVVGWQYELARHADYDPLGAEILAELKPRLGYAVQGAALLRAGLEGGLRLGALIERIDGAAFLIDRERRISEANREAAAALEGAVLVGSSHGVLSLRDPTAQRWLEESVGRLVDGLAVANNAITFGAAERIMRASLTPAPEHADGGPPLLVRPRPLLLLVIATLIGGQTRLDATALRYAFNLSQAEIRLCEALVNGRSLLEAAELLNLSEGTVRQRVKLVFNKTATHRQGELVALLARFRADQ